MAGTGHPYEVINVAEAKAILGLLSHDIVPAAGREWFLSRAMLRYVTSPAFVVSPSPVEIEELLSYHPMEEKVRAILKAKLQSGGDLRVFDKAFLDGFGMDLRHIVDWLNALPEFSPRLLRKLPRITAEAAKRHADEWVSAIARKANTTWTGATEVVMEPQPGFVWLELRDRDALKYESNHMLHCVRDYHVRLDAGSRIFSLRDQMGKPWVTAEIVEIEGCLVVNQLKAHMNRPPASEHRGAIIALLNHFDVTGDRHNEALVLSIVRSNEGTWASMAEVAERVDVHGMPGFRRGDTVHVSSRTASGRILVALRSRGEETPSGNGWLSRCMVRLVEPDTHTLMEQRMVAEMLNMIGSGPSIVDEHYLRIRPEGYVPWLDTLAVAEFGGVTCYIDEHGNHYVMNESLREVLLTFKKGGRDAVAPAGRNEWPESYLRRMAKVLTAVDIGHFDMKGRYEAFRNLRRVLGTNRWFLMSDEAVIHPMKAEISNDGALHWLVAPSEIEVGSSNGTRSGTVSIHCEADGSVRSINTYRFLDGHSLEVAEDACRLLNELGRAPGRAFRPEWTGFKVGSTEQKAFAFIGGKWRVFRSQEEVKQAIRGVGRSQFKDAGARSAVGHLLVGDPAFDPKLARHLVEWLCDIEKPTFSALFGNEKCTLSTALKKLSEIRDHLTEAQRFKVARVAAKAMRDVIGRTKRPRIEFSFSGRAERVRQALHMTWRDQPEAFVARVVKWFMNGTDRLTTTKDGLVFPDARWLEIVRGFPPKSEVRYAMVDGARSAMWSFEYGMRHEGIRIETPDALLDWIDLFELGTIYYWYRAHDREFLTALDAIASLPGRGDDWDEARSRLLAVREKFDERERKAA